MKTWVTSVLAVFAVLACGLVAGSTTGAREKQTIVVTDDGGRVLARLVLDERILTCMGGSVRPGAAEERRILGIRGARGQREEGNPSRRGV